MRAVHKRTLPFSENYLSEMYYHQIDFPTQALFFFYSCCAGIIDGFFALILCSRAIKNRRVKLITDIAFCFISVLILVCTNIIFQDAALRVYEVFAFLSALLLFLILFKKRSDAITEKFYMLIRKYILIPIFHFCKLIINICKKILKKIYQVVYNFIYKCKELLKRNVKKEKSKKEEKRKARQTAS